VPAECTPVTISFETNILRVYLEGSSERVAILTSPALFRLVSEFPVTFAATICGKRQKTFAAAKSSREHGTTNSIGVKYASLRIVVYGFLQQRFTVADILADGNLYLQHPGETEFDRAVKYMNPQYLLPPGEDMPQVEKLSIYTCCAGRGVRHGPLRATLGEHDKNQIFKIFDTAYDSEGVMATIDPSPRLVTELKRYSSHSSKKSMSGEHILTW
jgi:SWI/SNF-related matrix-associated actin-dependent regulator of chromatin subfamily A3